MPMLYAISSTISLFSLQLAEMIDLMRDLYEVRLELCILTSRPLLSIVSSIFWWNICREKVLF